MRKTNEEKKSTNLPLEANDEVLELCMTWKMRMSSMFELEQDDDGRREKRLITV
jgi:hypothetical protein